MLTRHAIEEFQAIYQKKYGVMLADAEATEMATSLLNLCRTVFATSIVNQTEPSPANRGENHAH